MVDHQLGDDLQSPAVRLAHHDTEVVAGAVLRVHVVIVGDVVAVVLERRRIERQHPDGIHAQVLDVIEL